MFKPLMLAVMVTALAACGSGSDSKGKDDHQPDPTPNPDKPPQLNLSPKITQLQLSHATPDALDVGDTISLSYVYQDEENDVEGNTEINWYLDKTQLAASGQTQINLGANYFGKTLTVTVTPVAKTGTAKGNTEQTRFKIHADTAPSLSNVTITDSNQEAVRIGDILSLSYTYKDAERHPKDDIKVTWRSDGAVVQDGESTEYQVQASDVTKTISALVQVSANGLWSTETEAQQSHLVIPNLAFSNQDDAVALVGQSYHNPAISDFAITYSSSQPDVAEVDANGNVILKQEGEVEISADDGYSQVQYGLRALPNKVKINARIASANSTLSMSGDLRGMTLHTSTEFQCEPKQPDTCSNLQSTPLDNYSSALSQISDFNITNQQTGILSLEFGDQIATAQLSANALPFNYGTAFIKFKNRLWAFGGLLADHTNSNRIFSTTDGSNWIEHTQDSTSLFYPTYHHQVVEFKGRLLLVGGTVYEATDRPSLIRNDVWTSEDGINWTHQPDANLSPVHNHYLTVADNKVWIAGGNLLYLTYSEDGINWKTTNSFAQWGSFLTTFINDQNQEILVKVKGSSVFTRSTDTDDPNEDWAQVVELPNSYVWNAHPYDNKLILLTTGATTGMILHPDGSTEAFEHDLNIHTDITLNFFNNQFYALPRSNATLFGFSPYRSDNGRDWAQSNTAAFKPRARTKAVVHNGELVVASGQSAGGLVNDVWTTTDGFTWVQRRPSSEEKGLPDMTGQNNTSLMSSLASFDGRLYFMNYRGLYQKAEDNWDWEAIGIPAIFPNGQIVATQDHLYYIGVNSGARESILRVYRMDKNLRWTALDDTNAIDMNYGFSVAANDDTLFVAGGTFYGDQTSARKVWKSTNGEDWIALPDMPSERNDLTLIAHDDNLFIYGGGVLSRTTSTLLSLENGQWVEHEYDQPARGGAFGGILGDELIIGGGFTVNGRAHSILATKNLNEVYTLKQTVATFETPVEAVEPR